MNLKAWKCKNNHVLGRIEYNGDRVPQLLLYRQAIDLEADKPAEVDLLGPLMGRMPVRCGICDDVKLWDMTVNALVWLLVDLDDEQMASLEEQLGRLKRREQGTHEYRPE